jgi:hypothetical protein
MRVKLGLTGLLAALLVAALPGASSAGWCSALTAGSRSANAPAGVSAEAQARGADTASSDSVFKLACNRCGRCGYGSYYPGYSGYYSGYASYYPGFGSYYSGYGSYYSLYGSYYSGYGSYYPSYSYYSGCNGCSPCGCNPIWGGYYSGW